MLEEELLEDEELELLEEELLVEEALLLLELIEPELPESPPQALSAATATHPQSSRRRLTLSRAPMGESLTARSVRVKPSTAGDSHPTNYVKRKGLRRLFVMLEAQRVCLNLHATAAPPAHPLEVPRRWRRSYRQAQRPPHQTQPPSFATGSSGSA